MSNLIKRNEFLIKVKELAEQYWPSDSKAMKKSNGRNYNDESTVCVSHKSAS